MTVFPAAPPNPMRNQESRELKATVLRNPLNANMPRRPPSGHTFFPDARERKLSVIIDDDGKAKTRFDDEMKGDGDSGHDSIDSQSSAC